MLTAMLAGRCDRVLSCHVAAGAVRAAARRTRDLPQVLVERRQIPREWPDGRFDLVVFSEILYYFGDRDLEQVLDRGVRALEPGGTLLAVHWRHPVAEYPRSGDDAHRLLSARPGLARMVSHQEEDFLAEVYRRTEGQPASVARATGLVLSRRRPSWCPRTTRKRCCQPA